MADLVVGVGRFTPVPEITLDDMDYPRGVDPNGISIQEIGRYIGRAFAPDDLQVDILEQNAYGEADAAYSKFNIDIYSQQVLEQVQAELDALKTDYYSSQKFASSVLSGSDYDEYMSDMSINYRLEADSLVRLANARLEAAALGYAAREDYEEVREAIGLDAAPTRSRAQIEKIKDADLSGPSASAASTRARIEQIKDADLSGPAGTATYSGAGYQAPVAQPRLGYGLPAMTAADVAALPYNSAIPSPPTLSYGLPPVTAANLPGGFYSLGSPMIVAPPKPYISPYAPTSSPVPPARPGHITKDVFGNTIYTSPNSDSWNASRLDRMFSGTPNPEGTVKKKVGGGFKFVDIKTGEQHRSKQGSGDVSSHSGEKISHQHDQPILLDLDGNGVKIDDLSRSTMFVDAGGDGLKHRTAWAGAGDGVLFFDADGDGAISQKREYVFTEWDPTASSDMEALRAYFDTNGDGKLTTADANFAKFKVMVTNADGSKVVKTLAQLGITEINLTEDATRIVSADGSVIEGRLTCRKADSNRRLRGAGRRSTSARRRCVGFCASQIGAQARIGCR